VRRDNAGGPAPSPDGSTLYFVTPLKRGGAGWGWEVRKARPEDGPSQILARIAGSRVPVNPLLIQPTVSPDGNWIALPLIDGVTTNLWALPTEGGPMQKLTDFGDWPIIIARRVSWSADSKHIYAAVAELDGDVVLLDGLLR
jgi:Tol biopolymer transport system component